MGSKSSFGGRTMQVPRALFLVTACALGLVSPPSALSAQRFPGAPGGDGMSAQANMAEYMADVVLNVNQVMEAWRSAWAADDVEETAEQYTEDATFIFGDEDPVRGREAIQARLGTLLPTVGEVQTAMQDLDASGRMGMIAGLLTLQVRDGSTATTQTGLHMTILIRRRGEWRIRSQIFRLDD